MHRWKVALILLLLGPLVARGQDDADLRQAKALERTMQRMIQQNEACIACLLPDSPFIKDLTLFRSAKLR